MSVSGVPPIGAERRPKALQALASSSVKGLSDALGLIKRSKDRAGGKVDLPKQGDINKKTKPEKKAPIPIGPQKGVIR
ncbi:MAG: hypothetical protein HQ564_06660 [Candidatus Saganbacteria bacterium]|nr:hypothetical protein [Candidatus Saganbacteria bacterium]